MTEHTPGPWYVRDFREMEMRRLGWTGPSIDRILIVNKTGTEIEASSGANCVIARIQFDNRTEPLSDSNIADARLIAAAPDMLAVLKAILDPDNESLVWFVSSDAYAMRLRDDARAAIAKATLPAGKSGG